MNSKVDEDLFESLEISSASQSDEDLQTPIKKKLLQGGVNINFTDDNSESNDEYNEEESYLAQHLQRTSAGEENIIIPPSDDENSSDTSQNITFDDETDVISDDSSVSCQPSTDVQSSGSEFRVIESRIERFSSGSRKSSETVFYSDEEGFDEAHSDNFTTPATAKVCTPRYKDKSLPHKILNFDLSPVVSLENSYVNDLNLLVEEKPEGLLNIKDIVSKLSAIDHEISVKQVQLETSNGSKTQINENSLEKRMLKLQAEKASLEKEIESCEDYEAQKSGLNNFGALQKGKRGQTDLHDFGFISSSIDTTEDFVEARDVVDLTQEECVVDESAKLPTWDDLPTPAMTLSGLGKRAMQTHLTEKALTLDALSQLHTALKTCPSEDALEEDPHGLKVELLPHQKHALAWMLWREGETPSGGILADDMGLGKTLSMISLVLRSNELEDGCSSDSESPTRFNSRDSKIYKGGTLVVCPASLVSQWENEIFKRTGRNLLTVELYHGSNRETKPRRLARRDVVITTYNLVSRESAVETVKNCTVLKKRGPLFYIDWQRVVLDEAHIVRNHKSQMALGVCELRAKKRWCLTGTPIHNKQLDLYALLKFLRCSPFDDLLVWKRWVDNKDAAGLKRLNTMMKSLMLRRTKEQLQSQGELKCLPAKTHEIINVTLDPEELEIYECVSEFSRTLFAQFLGQRAEKQQLLDARYGYCNLPTWQQSGMPDNQFRSTEELAHLHLKMQGLTEIKTFEILLLLLRLRQICCHSGLITKMLEDGDLDCPDVEDDRGLDVDLFNQMSNLNIGDNHEDMGVMLRDEKKQRTRVMSRDNPVFSFDRPSAKIKAVLSVLEDNVLNSGDKAIVVSQWTSFLNIVLKFLADKNVKCASFSGEIPLAKRQDIVDSFNRASRGPQVLLLSLTAGGVGLNLCGANHLLLIDIHWNPQQESQACDRIYRVGQKKPVHIYRFITVDTIEERVKQMQDRKLALASDVLTGTKNTEVSKLSLNDLKMLFSVNIDKIPESAALAS